jgi:hypothetical protein
MEHDLSPRTMIFIVFIALAALTGWPWMLGLATTWALLCGVEWR